MTHRRQVAAASVALLLVAVGCSGGSGDVDTAAAPSTSAAAATPSVEAAPAPAVAPTTLTAPPAGPAKAVVLNDVPDVEVVEVASGKKIRLHSLFTGDKPVLLWFWAPH